MRAAIARAGSTAAPGATATTAAVIAAAAGAPVPVATARVLALVRSTAAAAATGLLPTIAIVVRRQLHLIRCRRGIVASDRLVAGGRSTRRLVSQTTRRVRVRCSSVRCGAMMAGAV
jgi:hypothetical protein